MKCEKCSYEWKGRVIEPKTCPRCKTRLDIIKMKEQYGATRSKEILEKEN